MHIALRMGILAGVEALRMGILALLIVNAKSSSRGLTLLQYYSKHMFTQTAGVPNVYCKAYKSISI